LSDRRDARDRKSIPTADLARDFFGRDPIRGEDASLELLRRLGPSAIETLIPLRVPLEDRRTYPSLQTAARLKSVSERLGPSIVPYLTRVIEEGPWFSKANAAACFAGFEDRREIEAPLLAVLERASDFDAERLAIEALTYLGADKWAWDLAYYSTAGVWRPGTRVEWDDVDRYAFGKTSAYVLEAIARFVANARTPERVHALFQLLTQFIEQRERHLPGDWPDSYHVAARQTGHFTGWVLDPMIALWGRGQNEALKTLCLKALEQVAPLRGAGFLLETATDQRAPSSVRTSASIALGELRHPGAAHLLADSLREPSVDRTDLAWAFSTMYAVPADWTGLEDYVDELLGFRGEVHARLCLSLALRKDRRIERRLIDRLDDADSFQRWTAAVALARLLGSESRDYLEGRAEQVSDEAERCGMLAALLRAGDQSAAGRLHDALQSVSLDLLQSVWQIELLDAFSASTDFDSRAVRVWRVAAGINPRKLQYFEALAPAAAQPSRAPLSRRKIFISYSHHDASWLQRFQIMLRPLLDADRLEIWDDTKIVSGRWRDLIDEAMRESSIALFLVSGHFLASEFITRTELPALIRYAHDERGIQILWVLLDDCLWEVSPLADYQGENANQPLTLLSQGEQSRAIKMTCLRIRDLMAVAVTDHRTSGAEDPSTG
jgi:hypothetical protein